MKNLANKVDDISTLPANGFNSHAEENENAVTASGQTLDATSETTPDPDTQQLARAMTICTQSADFYADGGVANAYVLNVVGSWVQPTAYFSGMRVRFIPANANTTSCTINVISLGVKNLKNNDGSNLVSGDLSSTRLVEAYYNLAADEFRIYAGISAASVTPVPTGSIFAFAGTTAPAGFLLCDGSAVSRTTFATLFGIIGTAYGNGDGSSTFNVPDLRGRVAVGKDDMGGTAANRITNAISGFIATVLGANGGSQSHTLVTNELPAHTHQNNFEATLVDEGGSNSWPALANVGSGGGAANMTSQSAGGGQPHRNVQPSLVTNYIIKT